jgi:hypothetical protein
MASIVMEMAKRCSNLENKKEKTKPSRDQGKGINRDFVLPVRHYRECNRV